VVKFGILSTYVPKSLKPYRLVLLPRYLGRSDMPIEKDEFNKGKHDIEIQNEILSFLRASSTKAFTLEEIMKGIGHIKDTDDLHLVLMQSISYSIILAQLIKDRRIISKMINYQNYYVVQ
jgi:hypothetical protein